MFGFILYIALICSKVLADQQILKTSYHSRMKESSTGHLPGHFAAQVSSQQFCNVRNSSLSQINIGHGPHLLSPMAAQWHFNSACSDSQSDGGLFKWGWYFSHMDFTANHQPLYIRECHNECLTVFSSFRPWVPVYFTWVQVKCSKSDEHARVQKYCLYVEPSARPNILSNHAHSW